MKSIAREADGAIISLVADIASRWALKAEAVDSRVSGAYIITLAETLVFVDAVATQALGAGARSAVQAPDRAVNTASKR